MKKIFRILTSAILVALLAFGSFSTAFAGADVPVIEWTDGYDSYTYYYSGDSVKEGVNTVNWFDCILSDAYPVTDEVAAIYPFYYDFNVEKAGYYHVYTADTATGYGVPKTLKGNKADGYSDYITYGEESDSIMYLEKGKTIFGVIFSASDTGIYLDKYITIEYLGSKISSWEIDKNVLDDFVIGKNIWEERIGEFGFGTDCKITFDSGKVIDATEVYITGTCPSTPKSGKSTGTISLFGNRKTVEFTAAYLNDIIKSVEVSNADRYTTFITDYTGETRYSPLNNETVTVNYKNGTSASVQLSDGQGEIALSNGLVVPVYAGLTMNNNGKYDFVITVYDEVYSKTATTVEEGTLFDNIGYLTDDNFDALSRAGSDIVTGFSYILVDPEFSSISFGLIAEDLLSIFSNFMAFVSYCFSF